MTHMSALLQASQNAAHAIPKPGLNSPSAAIHVGVYALARWRRQETPIWKSGQAPQQEGQNKITFKRRSKAMNKILTTRH